jgi:hypothetical protein
MFIIKVFITTTDSVRWCLGNGMKLNGRSQWPRGLRRRSAAAWLLGSRVPNPLRAWMFVYVLHCAATGIGEEKHTFTKYLISVPKTPPPGPNSEPDESSLHHVLEIHFNTVLSAGPSVHKVSGVGLDRLEAVTVCSNPAYGMDVCLHLFISIHLSIYH